MRLPTAVELVGGLALLMSAFGVVGQGTFQNLDFESATVSGEPGTFVSFSQAFPEWTGYVAGVQTSGAVYDQVAMSVAGFSIIDSAYQVSSAPAYASNGGLIEGDYTAVLMSGVAGVLQPSAATLAQTGLVPADAESLQFKAQFCPFNASGSFDVTLGGQTLSLVPVATGANYTEYAADIHAFAGETAQLDFIVNVYPHQDVCDYLYLDSIQFSSQPIPEPSVFGLSASGALLLGWRVLRRRR